MSDSIGSSGAGPESREVAERLAQGIVLMVKQARSAGCDFLAYLLRMALKECRRIAQGEREG